MKAELDKKLDELKKAAAENRVKHRWQDEVLNIMQEFNLPRKLQSEKDLPPLDVTAVLMRHGKQDLNKLKRRFATVKEKGFGGEQAVKYYLGIVEKED